MSREWNVTREGITVRVGQVWRDLDKRMKRTVTVEDVVQASPAPYAFVRSSAGVASRIRITRMHKHGQGFALVSDPQP